MQKCGEVTAIKRLDSVLYPGIARVWNERQSMDAWYSCACSSVGRSIGLRSWAR